jgi:hypothetical protein
MSAGRFNPFPRMAGRYPPVMGEVSDNALRQEYRREMNKRKKKFMILSAVRDNLSLDFRFESSPICKNCGVNETYYDSPTMDWCESCLWNLIKDDQTIVLAEHEKKV